MSLTAWRMLFLHHVLHGDVINIGERIAVVTTRLPGVRWQGCRDRRQDRRPWQEEGVTVSRDCDALFGFTCARRFR